MVQGVAALHQRFQRVPRVVTSAAIDFLEGEANRLVAEMRAIAPRRSGVLIDSIGWTWGDAPRGTLVIGTFRGRQFGILKITVYAGGKDAFWAFFQEFGTQKMRAHPFFFPVYRANRRRIRSGLTRTINKAIKGA